MGVSFRCVSYFLGPFLCYVWPLLLLEVSQCGKQFLSGGYEDTVIRHMQLSGELVEFDSGDRFDRGGRFDTSILL